MLSDISRWKAKLEAVTVQEAGSEVQTQLSFHPDALLMQGRPPVQTADACVQATQPKPNLNHVECQSSPTVSQAGSHTHGIVSPESRTSFEVDDITIEDLEMQFKQLDELDNSIGPGSGNIADTRLNRAPPGLDFDIPPDLQCLLDAYPQQDFGVTFLQWGRGQH
jgi:hypothetical protein